MIVEAGYSDMEYLDLGANRVREEGVKALIEPSWADLHTLILSLDVLIQMRRV